MDVPFIHVKCFYRYARLVASKISVAFGTLLCISARMADQAELWRFWRAPIQWVEKACARENLNGYDVARKAGVSDATWCRWRKGEVAGGIDKFGDFMLELHAQIRRQRRKRRGNGRRA